MLLVHNAWCNTFPTMPSWVSREVAVTDSLARAAFGVGFEAVGFEDMIVNESSGVGGDR